MFSKYIFPIFFEFRDTGFQENIMLISKPTIEQIPTFTKILCSHPWFREGQNFPNPLGGGFCLMAPITVYHPRYLGKRLFYKVPIAVRVFPGRFANLFLSGRLYYILGFSMDLTMGAESHCKRGQASGDSTFPAGLQFGTDIGDEASKHTITFLNHKI